ncbi:hypothetical protein ACFL9U_09590, partial [Thermodesulfobacteriota bacterium]
MKRWLKILTIMFASFFLLVPASFSQDGDPVESALCDVNGDSKVGLEEVIYTLRVLTGLTPDPNSGSSGSADRSVQGYIVEDTGDENLWVPIPEAEVTCQLSSGEVLVQQTNAYGFFKFDGVSSVLSEVKAVKDGFTLKNFWVNFESNPSSEIILRLNPGNEIKEGSLEGTVFSLNPSGELLPTPQAFVTLIPVSQHFPPNLINDLFNGIVNDLTDYENLQIQNPVLTIATDESGYFKFENVPIGRYLVRAIKAGFRTATGLTFILSNRVSKMDLVMSPEVSGTSGSLFGRVVEKVNDSTVGLWKRFIPLESAEVHLVSDNNNQEVLRAALTNQLGMFQFFNVPVGDYKLKIEHQGFEPYVQSVRITESSYFPLPIKGPVPGEDPNDSTASWMDNGIGYDTDLLQVLIDFLKQNGGGAFCIDPKGNWHYDVNFTRVLLKRESFEPQAGLLGHVYSSENPDDANEKISVSGATVTASPIFPYHTLIPVPVFITTTDDNGFYQFSDLPVGYAVNGEVLYLVNVEAEGFKPASKRVMLQLGNQAELDFILAPFGEETGMLSGHIYHAYLDFGPIEGAEVVLTRMILSNTQSYPMEFRTHTDAAGFYILPDLPAGEYLMLVKAEGFRVFQGHVTVISGKETVKEIHLIPLVAVSNLKGHVYDGSVDCTDENSVDCSVPVANARVSLSSIFSINDATLPSDKYEKTSDEQ